MSETLERAPRCPECTHDGAVDGLGRFTRSFDRDYTDKSTSVVQRWMEFHCPECDATFAVLEKEVESRR